jgi:hypothetical protein
MATVALSGIITPSNVVTATSTATLTNKTISGASNTLSNIPLSTAVTGNLPVTNLNSGTSASASTFWRGDGAWAAPSGGFTLGTPVASTSGTSIDFTGIPAGTKQIVVSFNSVSTNGTSPKIIRLGDAGGIETTGYEAACVNLTTAANVYTNVSSGFIINSIVADHKTSGSMTFILENATAFRWTATGSFMDRFGYDISFLTAGEKALSQELDRIRITTVNGTDTFDLGEINIAYI